MEPSIRAFGYPTMAPDQLLESVFDLTGEQARLYEWMVEHEEPIIPSDVVEYLGCSSSSAYRYIDSLQTRGLVVEKATYRSKQLRSGYVAKSPAAVADALETWREERFEMCMGAIEEGKFSDDVELTVG